MSTVRDLRPARNVLVKVKPGKVIRRNGRVYTMGQLFRVREDDAAELEAAKEVERA